MDFQTLYLIIPLIFLVATIFLFFYRRVFSILTGIGFVVSLILYPPILQYLLFHPFLTLSLFGIGMIAISYYLHHLEYLGTGLGIFLIGLFADWYAPPYSAVCFSAPGAELSGLAQQPLSNWATDTFMCKLYIDHFPNFTLHQLSSPSMIQVVFPILLVSLIIFAGLSFLYTRFSIAFFFTFIYGLVLSYVYQNIMLGDVYITMATIFGYMIIPPLLGLLGFTLILFLGKFKQG